MSRTAPKVLPPTQFLRECFEYIPETGELFWKERPVEHFKTRLICQTWNQKHAGTPAFSGINSLGYHYGYVTYGGVQKQYTAHRVAWKVYTGSEPPSLIDHRDRNPSNNRWDNLRPASKTQNSFNRDKIQFNLRGCPRRLSGALQPKSPTKGSHII